MKTDDLLEELRRECPILFRILASWRDFGDKDALLVLEQLAALIAKRERTAAERMREQRDEARRAAIGYALVGCDEGVFEREECEDVNEWMHEHGVLSLADVLEGLPVSAEEPEEPSQ